MSRAVKASSSALHLPQRRGVAADDSLSLSEALTTAAFSSATPVAASLGAADVSFFAGASAGGAASAGAQGLQAVAWDVCANLNVLVAAAGGAVAAISDILCCTLGLASRLRHGRQ